MIEVEVRARVKDFGEAKNNLNKIGAKLISKSRQVDHVFAHNMFLDESHSIREGGFSARVRQVDDNTKIDFKEIWRKRGHGMQISAPVNTVKIGIEFLEKMGWEESFVIDKFRETYSYRDFKICLDKVKLLGVCIEVEKTLNSKDKADEAKQECSALLNKIAPNHEIITKYYGDIMNDLLRKKRAKV